MWEAETPFPWVEGQGSIGHACSGADIKDCSYVSSETNQKITVLNPKTIQNVRSQIVPCSAKLSIPN